MLPVATMPRPDAPPIMATFNRATLAVYIGRSLPALDRDIIAGRIPRGFKLGRSWRWLRSEIDGWLQAGAPPADEWEAMKRRAAR